MGEIDAKVGTVTADAPIADAALISASSGEAGLWLWHGEAPAPLSAPQSKSRIEHILTRIPPGARRAGWIALPCGLALALLAISVMHPPPHRPESANRPAVALAPAASPAIARPITATAPTQTTNGQVDQVRVPPPPEPQISGQAPDRRMVSWHAQHKSARTVRKTHASRIRRGPPMLIYGVLTPPSVMTWHGGGY